MRKIIIILCAFAMAGELEVDGNLTVTEGVTASSFIGDGSGLTNIPSLGGIKPERIYTLIYQADDAGTIWTVPANKFWIINVTPGSSNDWYFDYLEAGGGLIRVGIYGNDLSQPALSRQFSAFHGFSLTGASMIMQCTIYEYSISGSGTDQGMDYIEP